MNQVLRVQVTTLSRLPEILQKTPPPHRNLTRNANGSLKTRFKIKLGNVRPVRLAHMHTTNITVTSICLVGASKHFTQENDDSSAQPHHRNRQRLLGRQRHELVISCSSNASVTLKHGSRTAATHWHPRPPPPPGSPCPAAAACPSRSARARST